jgi:hypothetical protein
MNKPHNRTNRPRELTPAEVQAVRERINRIRRQMHAAAQKRRA